MPSKSIPESRMWSAANAPSEFKFGQMIRVDGDEAKKVICRLLNSRARRPVVASIGTFPKRLKVVSVEVYGTQMRALLDSVAIPNATNASVAWTLSLYPKVTWTKIAVANGQKKTCVGSTEEFNISFNVYVTLLNSLVGEGAPIYILIAYPTLEELEDCIDLSQQSVKMIGNKNNGNRFGT